MEMELEVDDDGEFLAAAREDDALVAHLLICLSRSKTCVPWHRQLPESKSPLLSPTWGRRRARSGASVSPEGAKREEEEEAVGGASPATPLSWSGASGTCGSGSDDGWSTPLRPPKRQQRGGAHEREEPMQGPEVCHGGGEQIGAPPAKGTVPESSGRGCPAPNWATVDRSDDGGEPHRDFVVAATPVVGSPAAGSGSGSSKTATAVAVVTRELGPARSIAHAQPLRSRWTAEGANSMGVGRQGKKKTLLELRAMKDSLLREQEQLRKELGKRREIYGALLGENMSLKKLESSLPSLAASKPHVAPLDGEAISEEHQQSASERRQEANGMGSAYVHGDGREQPQRTSSSSSTQALAFPFDLNCVPSDGDL